MRVGQRFSFEGKIALAVLTAVCAGAGIAVLLRAVMPDPGMRVAVTLVLLLPPALWLARRIARPVSRTLRAMQGVVSSYREGDFSVSLPMEQRDEMGELMRLQVELGESLQQERQHLVAREMLLDTVVQHTPVALLLIDPHERVVFDNLAARQLLNDGCGMAGMAMSAVLEQAPIELQQGMRSPSDVLIEVPSDNNQEVFHVSGRDFRLQGRAHRLVLIRRMTRVLSRQEVSTWKKVIRVITHELNNSLAPISSLAHSGAELAQRGELGRLPEVFATIGDRAHHLQEFIAGYASIAKLPAPRPTPHRWSALFEPLHWEYGVSVQSPLPDAPVNVDGAQFATVLTNLCKNAIEAGSPAGEVTLAARATSQGWSVEVADRGAGMSETVLARALLPFYSTKRSGTGLGLALAREIVEAHGGRLQLANREGGGLLITISLPSHPPDATG